MAKEWILNQSMNRWGLNKKNSVGPVSELILGVQIKPAPDDWDRLYNVDFFIEVKNKYIGIQIKPITSIERLIKCAASLAHARPPNQ